MPKAVKTIIRLQIPAGQANPAPPIGPALGQHGLNIQDFCTRFNDATKEMMGDIIPVKLISIDDQGRLKLSRKAAMTELGLEDEITEERPPQKSRHREKRKAKS